MEKINWVNGQAGGTPLSAENMNQMQDYIEEAINNITGHVLWANSDITSDFAAQTVNLTDTDYDFIKIVYKYYKSSAYIMSQETLKNYSTVLGAGFTYANQAGGETVMRTVVSASSGAQLTFREGKQQLGSTESTNNGYCIPIYVIGYKTGLFS